MPEESVTSNAARDRARGALVGLAVGDAVGTTVEFAEPGSFTPLTDMVGGGPFGLSAGEWTDDTSMALCMAESIVDKGVLDLADHHRRYLSWRNDGRLSSNGRCFDIGLTVSDQLSRFDRTGLAIDPSPDQEAAANGSLMRLAAAPIAWRADVATAAAFSGESSRSTHAATRPVDACRLMGAMLASLINGVTAEDVFSAEFWQWGDLHPQISAIAGGSYALKSPPAIRGTGFCVDALEAALWAVAGADDFRTAILRAANLGDDADTTAAIAGQLAGARWGLEAIPQSWRDRLVELDRITSLADALFDLEASAPVNRSWEFESSLHAWWVVNGSILAGEYPSTASGGSNKLELLLDAGIRTFIDLTTTADGLVPYEDMLMQVAVDRGLTVRHLSFPITDTGTIELSGYREIVDAITRESAAGRPVFVHCWSGVGRTSTVVECLQIPSLLPRSTGPM